MHQAAYKAFSEIKTLVAARCGRHKSNFVYFETREILNSNSTG